MKTANELQFNASQIAELVKAIQSDSGLKQEEKQAVIDKLHDSAYVNKMTASLAGGSIGLLVAKYLKLSKTAKVLLALAGFGIGRALWGSIHDDTKKFQEYNNKLKVYEIR